MCVFVSLYVLLPVHHSLLLLYWVNQESSDASEFSEHCDDLEDLVAVNTVLGVLRILGFT